MSKYGYFGGNKRPIDSSLKGDPEGPSLEELQRFFKVVFLLISKNSQRQVILIPSMY